MVDVPIGPPCCVVLTDSRNTGKIPERCKIQTNCFKRYKSTLLIGTVTILLLFSLLRLLMYFIIVQHDYKSAVGVQPESRVERVIALNFPVGGESLSQLKPEEMINENRSVNGPLSSPQNETTDDHDAFATMNRAGIAARRKRDMPRRRRECKLNEEHCKTLLKSMRVYFEALATKRSNKGTYSYEDIMRCLQCKNLETDMANEIRKEPRLYDRYFPHEYVEQNRSSDLAIKLLDDRELDNSTKCTEGHGTETKVQPTEASFATSQSTVETSRSSISSETSTEATVSVDYTSPWPRFTQVHASVTETANVSTTSDARPTGNSSVYSQITKVQKTPSNESVHAEHSDVIAKSKGTLNDLLQLTTTESSTTTTAQYSIIRKDSAISGETTVAAGSSGTKTRNHSIDLANQIAITENVTTVPKENVTGITGVDDTVHPSEHPSLEGQPEAQPAILENEARSMDGYYSINSPVLLKHPPTDKNKENHQTIMGSTKSFQELQLTPTMWTTQPICFFSYPGQASNKPPLGVAPFLGSFMPSAPQDQGFPSQASFRHTSPSQPNYMQVQAQTVQFLPRSNPNNRQGIGPTGPTTLNAPIYPMNQQQSDTDMPYFCTYIPIPTYNLPSIAGTSQSSRSSKVEHTEKSKLREPQSLLTLTPKDNPPQQNYYPWNPYLPLNSCPEDYRRCGDQVCIPQTKWCDSHVDCADASDETNCLCSNRIWQNRLCDGYFDCPNGEDELDCFNCSADFFNCDDWERPDNCVPLTQRCDGIKQCLNGKDELDCNILSPTRISENDILAIGYTEGFLHKNIRGRWYPVCSNTSYWAVDACVSEIGQPLTMMPQISFVQVPADVFQDPYVIDFNGQTQIVSCSGSAVFVKCPPLPCGTRALSNRDTFLVSRKNENMYNEDSQTTQSQKFYRETLDLLKEIHTTPDENQNEDKISAGSQPRVVGGYMSEPKAWPFLVAIYKDGEFHCGGVILNEVYILTAAHCMSGYEKHYFEVEAGVLRRLSFSPTAQLRRAIYVILHPNYDIVSFRNDVALIMLDKAFLFNRWIRPICLPTVSTAGPAWKQGPTPQSICVAVGWGAVREFGPDPDHLQEVAIPILSSCKHLTDQINSTICAGYSQGGHDACQGDSGGPLLCRNPQLESQWYVAGIISHGDGCGRPNEPGVYTKVSYYVDWIQEVFKLGNSVSFYIYAHLQSLSKCPGFSCISGSKRCLPINKYCDKIIDCLEGEDEINCEQKSRRYRLNSDNKTMELNFRKKSRNEILSKVTVQKHFIEDGMKKFEDIRTLKETNEETSTFPALYDMIEELYDDSSIENDDDTMFKPTTDSVRLTFTCTRLIQTIPIDNRCDWNLDCEDGSDEENCTCRDYLSRLQPSAICDGHLDCKDETDEKNCGLCEDQFRCKSGKCISKTKKCNANYDCPMKDDELDCLALTDGEHIDLDNENLSVLRMEGIFSRYYGGAWHVQCIQQGILKNDTLKTAMGQNLCVYLGFARMHSVEPVVVYKTLLETRKSTPSYSSLPSHAAKNEEYETCKALRVRCRPVLSSSADMYLVIDPNTGSHNYLWPWLAAIFVDGRYHCPALLLEPDWLLTTVNCTTGIELSVNYTTALLGQSRSFLHVDGPHQQTSIVDEIKNVSKSEISLLHLKTAVNFTRYVRPMFAENKIYPPTEKDTCVAVAINKKRVVHSIFLQPVVEDCDKCKRCFVESKDFKCPINDTSSDWSGMVFCSGEKEWYPAATFHEETLCSFGRTQNWTSIDYVHAYLTQALEEELQPNRREPACDSVRCNLGQCIPWNRVCDGVMNCRNGEDETDEICENKRKAHSEMARECTRSQLQCGNGQCISKSDFCNRKVDCSDGTDEPVTCTCAEYLRLAAPKRLCDGVRHCLDKSDESPEECNCTETSFKCNAKETNSTCVPQDFVCDGNEDCPNGEDERECIKVGSSADDKSGTGEVMQRSFGVWHSRCFSASATEEAEEARNVCQKLGYKDGGVLHDNRTISEPLVPSRDDFYMIRINPSTWVTMRHDKPLISLVQPTETCHRLFVSCS